MALVILAAACGGAKSGGRQPRSPQSKVNATGRWIVTECRRIRRQAQQSTALFDCGDTFEIAILGGRFALVARTDAITSDRQCLLPTCLQTDIGGTLMAFENLVEPFGLHFAFTGQTGTVDFAYRLDMTEDVLTGQLSGTERLTLLDSGVVVVDDEYALTADIDP